MEIQHFPTCTAKYPEKLRNERPRQLTRVDLDDGEYVMQCVDCGAHSRVMKVISPNQNRYHKRLK